MYYTFITTVSALVLILTNLHLFLPGARKQLPAAKSYRVFLCCVLAFLVTDILWGLFYLHSEVGLHIVTAVYFVSQALSVLFWARFVFTYLASKDVWHRIVLSVGWVFFAFQAVLLIINVFTPIMYAIDGQGEYTALPWRYAAYGAQIIMFFAIAIYTFVVSVRSKGDRRARHLIIAIFSLVMSGAIIIQLYWPTEPYYSIGYMLGICALHSLVVNYERERAERELGETKVLAYTDSLTGVKSKHAYVDKESEIDQRISEEKMGPFAVAVFDLNDLKEINDTRGHEIGDEYLIEGTEFICHIFRNSPVFRVGGDEFVAILEGEDYDRREDLFREFNRRIDENVVHGELVISSGLADYIPEEDKSIMPVFTRADAAMYARKRELKKNALK